MEANPNACIADEEKVHRLSALKAVAGTNISAATFGELTAWIDSYSGPGLQVGDVKNLIRDYAETTLDSIINNIRLTQRNTFTEYSLSMDGTPSFAHAECIIVRFVSRSFDIYELVVRVGLFKNALSSDQLAHHILDCIHTRLRVPLIDWVAIELNHASTNKAAIRKITEEFCYNNPKALYCSSNGINNAGRLLIERSNFADELRKIWKQTIGYKGKCRDYSTEVFGQACVQSKGVRFSRKLSKLSKFLIKV